MRKLMDITIINYDEVVGLEDINDRLDRVTELIEARLCGNKILSQYAYDASLQYTWDIRSDVEWENAYADFFQMSEIIPDAVIQVRWLEPDGSGEISYYQSRRSFTTIYNNMAEAEPICWPAEVPWGLTIMK